MRVALGKFAQSGIETHLGVDLAAGVQIALAHYARRLRSGRAPVEPPWFCRTVGEDAGAPFELQVDPETEVVLARQARRHSLSMNQVLSHAVFVYLADLDSFSGRSPAGSSRLH